MTVLESIQRSTEFLDRKGVESPRLQAELLLAHVLGLPRMRLYLNFDRALSATELDALREMVRRRGLRIPLQHIVGNAAFCSLDLKVTPAVLVPRPETELLAEAGWTWLGDRARSASAKAPATALDWGTGSGCLAIALATQCPNAAVTACDVSAEALDLARENATRHQVANRISFILSDGFSGLPTGTDFDLIISNPPYIPTEEIATLAPEVRDHDPRLALDGGADGLLFYRRLGLEAGRWLRPGGRLMLELGDGQAVAVRGLLEAQNWVVEAIREDYNHHPRVLIAQTSTNG